MGTSARTSTSTAVYAAGVPAHLKLFLPALTSLALRQLREEVGTASYCDLGVPRLSQVKGVAVKMAVMFRYPSVGSPGFAYTCATSELLL